MAEQTRYNRKNYERPPQESPTGKLPPHDTELEEVVLGALMLEKDAYSNVADILTPDTFYDPLNAKIYEAISKLGLNQRPIDMRTVTDQLRSDGTLKEVGGAVRIAELTSLVYSAANVEYHAKLLAQKFLARRLITFSTKVGEEAFDESNDVEDLLQQAEGQLFDIAQNHLKREVTPIDPVLTLAIEQIHAAGASKTGLSGLRTGFTELDKITSGWQNSNLIIIAARPAMGKTALALTMAKNMAIDYNIPVGLFTLEMSNVELVKRLISNICELDGQQIKSGKITQEEWDRTNERIASVYNSPLYLDETAGLSITELRTKARRLVREKGVKIIMIDYLQLMNATGLKLGSREQEVSTISRSLKALAKELDIPIIALSQLNRSTESREDKRPVLSDLRESGAIEQDADIVCFIHRPEYYTKSTEDKDGNDIRGLAQLIVAKHRSGAIGDVKLRFVGKYARFENWDEGYQMMQQAFGNEPEHSGNAGTGRRESRMNGDSNNIPMSNFSFPPAPDTTPDILPDPTDSEVPF